MGYFVGTSGYAYKPWKGKFYPEDLPDKQMLGFYAEHFGVVEINNSFYRMPTGKLLATWAEQVPDDFCFVIKASRRITHIGRLKNVKDSVDFLYEATGTLGRRLGPLLFQLPPNMKADVPRLESFLAQLPDERRVALEFRNISWFDDAVYELLRGRNVALCVSDGELEEDPPLVSTADWGYLRLRGIQYADGELAAWRDRIRAQDWNDAYVFFKHEDEATGPELAQRFLALLNE